MSEIIIGANGNPPEGGKKDILYLEDEVEQPWWMHGPLEGCHLTYSHKGNGKLSTNLLFYAQDEDNDTALYRMSLKASSSPLAPVGDGAVLVKGSLGFAVFYNEGLKGTIEERVPELLELCKGFKSDAIYMPEDITTETFTELLNKGQQYFMVGVLSGDYQEDAKKPEDESRIVLATADDLAHVNATKQR